MCDFKCGHCGASNQGDATYCFHCRATGAVFRPAKKIAAKKSAAKAAKKSAAKV